MHRCHGKGIKKMSDKREKRLLHRIRKKQDKKAADKLIHKYYREIYAYVFRQVGGKEPTMDITQDIFLGMLQSIWSYDEAKSGFRTWLYHIAVHKVADYFRRNANVTAQAVKDFRGQENAEAYDTELLQQVAEQPGGGTEQQAVNEAMAGQILARLGHEDLILEELFRLKFYSECTFAEIAEILELPEATVKTKYYTAIKKLRKEFE